MAKRTRPKQVKFWSTEEELEIINKKAKKARLTKQEYLLRSALDKNILVVEGLKEVLLELVKEGNKLNEISRTLQEKEDREGVEDIFEVKEKLMKLYGIIESTLIEGKE